MSITPQHADASASHKRERERPRRILCVRIAVEILEKKLRRTRGIAESSNSAAHVCQTVRRPIFEFIFQFFVSEGTRFYGLRVEADKNGRCRVRFILFAIRRSSIPIIIDFLLSRGFIKYAAPAVKPFVNYITFW